MLNIAPRIIQTEKYLLKVRTHIISRFGKESAFKNNINDPKHTIHIPGFKIDSTGWALSSSSKLNDPTILVNEVFDIVFMHIKASADCSYGYSPRDVVLVEFVIESPDGIHVNQVGMGSMPGNVPLFNNPNTFSRA